VQKNIGATCLGQALLQLYSVGKLVQNIDGMIMAQDTEVLGEKSVLNLFQTQIPQALAWDRTRASTATGQRPTGDAMVRSNKEVWFVRSCVRACARARAATR
jgi:hypothetical protein